MSYSFVFLCVGAGLLLLGAVKNTANVRDALKKRSGPGSYLPRAVTMLVLAAQLSEMIRVVEQVSPIRVAAAVLLLAIVAAAKSGTESELR